MKLSKSVMFGAAACLLSTSASAQAAGDLLALSQYNYSFSTARSAALGGAFTSLGADLSSMSINPAGLGMYMSSDFGISPSLTWNNMQSTYLGTKSDYSRTRFTLGNLGMAFNLYQGSGTLTSFTLGVGYSKLADFNTTSAAYGQGIDKSITDVLAEYMNGVPLSSLGHPDNDPYQPFRRADVGLWGGILAYQTGILDPMSDAQDNKQYTVANNLATGSRTNPSMRNVNKGSIDEYSISGGFNIQNILYLGFTIGIQDILYRNDNYYAETYDNNSLPLNGMNYIRSLHLDGTGVNFKFGAVVRPVENLRIGVAVHTPTLVSINEEYIEWMSADYKNPARGELLDSPRSLNEYDINTPTRLLTGISYTLPGVGLITADYERVWYNRMKLRNMGTENWDFQQTINNEVSSFYQPANNFRVGIEATPAQNFYIRAGYANYGECIATRDAFNNMSSINSYENYSAGLGFRFQNMYVDLAYIYTEYKYAPYTMFYYGDPDYVVNPGNVETKQSRNTITMSVGVRF